MAMAELQKKWLEWGMKNWRDRIRVNAAICHGKACIHGTRVLVSAIVDNVAAGVSREEILKNYPTIKEQDIDAALAYAAELAREGVVDLPLETKA
jgi:uncharacterized protein (DUF433 family)